MVDLTNSTPFSRWGDGKWENGLRSLNDNNVNYA